MELVKWLVCVFLKIRPVLIFGRGAPKEAFWGDVLFCSHTGGGEHGGQREWERPLPTLPAGLAAAGTLLGHDGHGAGR